MWEKMQAIEKHQTAIIYAMINRKKKSGNIAAGENARLQLRNFVFKKR
jgi:hypothetical protein